MTVISPTTGALVNPPVLKTPPPMSPVPGSAAPLGAGSSVPGIAPPSDGSMPVLPFGNGVTPGIEKYTGSPMSAVNFSPPGVVGDPSVSVPEAPNPSDLGNTLIAPSQPAPLSGQAEAWRQKFGKELMPTDINGGPDVGGGSIDGGPNIGPATDARTQAAYGNLDAASGALANTDRRSMVNSLLSDFDKQQTEADNNAYTRSGRFSASLGRIGSGMAAQDINTITRQSMGDRNRFRNTLAADTADKEIGDRFGKLDAFRGLSGDAYSQGAGLRGEARGERGYQYGVNQDNRSFGYNRDTANRGFNYGVNRDNQNARTAAQETAYRFGNDRAGLDYGQGQDYRNELRGERSYQDTTAQNAINNRVGAAELSDRLTGSAFDRARQRYGIGTNGNPAGVYGAAAGDAQGQSDATQQAIMQYLQSLGVGRGARG